jgi:hypothetical protein
MAQSQSQSQSQLHAQKRGMADFFKPYAKSIPAKRPSPSTSPAPESQSSYDKSPKKQKKAPRTPASTTRFVDLGLSPLRSPFALGRSPKLPIRSPRPKEHGTPSRLWSTQSSSPLEKPLSLLNAPTPFLFSDLVASERSVVKDGNVVAVRDSDEDDSDSLESLADIFGRPRQDNTSSSSPPDNETSKENKRPSVLGVFSNRERQAIVGKERLRDILAKDRLHKFDISKLIDDHLDDAESKGKLDQANAYYEASARHAERDTGRSVNDQELLRNIIDGKGGDQDDVVRVMGAMERTGALASELSFSFFDRGGLRDWKDEAPPKHKFPRRDVPEDLWSLRHTECRDRAYLSGRVGDMAASGQLPDSVLKWTFESIALEGQDDLRRAYTECLSEVSKQWTRTNLTAQDVQDVFARLGADCDAIRDCSGIVPNRKTTPSERRRDPKFLLSVLEVFDTIVEDLDFESLSKLSSILTRLSLDDEVMDDIETSAKVENLLSRLLNLPNYQSRLHVAERILIDVYQNLKDHYLQARLLLHILPNSSLSARLRLVLAQVFVLPDHIPSLDLSEPPSISLTTLLQHLRSPIFDLAHRANNNSVNYTEICALTNIIDAALSDGGRPSRIATLAEEKAFNQQVDQLADRVNAIFSSIADTGASHMRRTEAKEALSVLQKRLLYSVRTRPRPKKSVFGGRDGKEYRSEEKSKSAMQNYLMNKEKTLLKDRPGNRTPCSQESETEKQIRKQLGLSQ